ncbi:acyltransferase family protein (plasmid) [Coraliomargarita sp. W4R53]
MSTPAPTQKLSRFAGLDGLRAIAVILVVVYHLFPPNALPGGFIGVDVFFVISGFLITSLLLREHSLTGKIALVPFWQRRARRLLPALAVVITVCSTLAWLVGGDVLNRLGAQVLGAATFSYNWLSITGDTGYFAASTPELFRNFWSLAVEEQFYLLWPLVLPLFFLLPRAWARVAVALGLALASAVWMGMVVLGTSDVTRAYFGTDTHAFGLLIGVAAAFAMTELKRVDAALLRASAARTITGAFGIVGLAGIVALALVPAGDDAATFPGALLGASVCTVAVIVAGVWPRSWLGPRLDIAPMRWIGARSYGIYLWHWPLLVLAVAAFEGAGPESGVPLWISVMVLVVTIGVSALSYRYLEEPIRTLGFGGALARLRDAFARSSRSRMRALGATAAVCIALSGTTAAIAAEPQSSSAEEYVAAGRAALEAAGGGDAGGGDAGGGDAGAVMSPRDDARTRSGAGVRGSGAPSARSDGATTSENYAAASDPASFAQGAPEPSSSATEVPSLTTEPSSSATDSASDSASTAPAPTAPLVEGTLVSAVGDSVMLASAPALLGRMPGIQIDAAVSRSTWAGPAILQNLADSNKLRDFVVLALGTNGPIDNDSMERMIEIIGPDRQVILVNAFAPRDWIPGVNKTLAEFAKNYPNVQVADWSNAIADHTDLLAGDKIHPGEPGGRVFADTVATAIEKVETDRLERVEYQRDFRTRIVAWLGGNPHQPTLPAPTHTSRARNE